MTRFFCPGRVILAGDQTDHQRGRVMAAAMDLGVSAEAEPNGEGVVRIFCEGFDPIQVELDRQWPDEKEQGSSAALVRGVAAGLSQGSGVPLRGFDAYLFSDLPPGHELASSTAFATLTGFMLAFFSGMEVAPEDLARIVQKAEARWFGKAGGPVDALTCAMGGGVYMDVLENRVVPIDCCFDGLGLVLSLTVVGGQAVPSAPARVAAAMGQVAQFFGEPFLSKVRGPVFDSHWPEHQGEAAWRQARHFFDETWRVASMADALGLHDGARYMELMNQSGRSAEILLQSAGPVPEQLALGLEEAGRLLRGVGAWRAHGSGFSGGVLALMPAGYFAGYQAAMDRLFGTGSCRQIHIPSQGVRLAQEDKRLFAAPAESASAAL